MSWLNRAEVIPGRSMTRSKKVFQCFAESADGAVITDTDGKTYIDMLCALGAISVGYKNGLSMTGVFSLPHRVEVQAAEDVLRYVAPWGSWVRFTKTGSEAMQGCYRIARAFTGRQRIVKCVGAYHGWHDWTDEHPGTLKPGDLPSGELAAVFVEPARFQPVDVEWLKALRDWCDGTGALLIFDSMIYGGRWAIGGASEYFGVQPDLEAYGKAYANGAAVSFLVGMDATKRHGEIPSGTFSGEVSGLHGLRHTLLTYRTNPVIETMWARGQQLRDGLKAVIPTDIAIVEGEPVCQRLRFFLAAEGQQFSNQMRRRGVLWHPDVVFTMYAHTEAQIAQVIQAAKDSLEAMA